jgi:hypothetical protein
VCSIRPSWSILNRTILLAISIDDCRVLIRSCLVWGQIGRIIHKAMLVCAKTIRPWYARRSSNVPSTVMKSYRRISLIFMLAALADGATAQAQTRADSRFNRVTTPGVRRTSATTPSSIRSVARSGGIAAVGGASSTIDALRPYSSHVQAQNQGQTDGTPQSSTWREQSVPAVAPQVVTESAPHNYYPGMRASRAIQQPVTLTARTAGVPHICTPSRSMMVGGGHHGR